MNAQKTLTKATALEYLRDNDSVDLNEFEQIEVEAAEVLARHHGELDLNGLATVSVDAAKALAKHKGTVFLEGVTSISDEAILVLAKGDVSHSCYGRTEAPPKSIPTTADEFVLAQIVTGDDESGVLYLAGPRPGEPLYGELSLQLAKQLSSYSGVEVYLNGWYTVESLDALKALGEGKFKEIHIRFKQVDIETVSALIDFKSELLGIESESITEEAAEKLLEFPYRLQVDLKRLPEEVREIFLRHYSLANWGSVSRPKIIATCRLCGKTKEFTLELTESCDELEKDYECLRREEWQYDDNAICDSCKDD